MPEELHAGYILSGIRKHLRPEGDLLRGLSSFVVDVEDWSTHQSDSLFCVVDNLLSRGLPTLPSCFVEDTLAEVLGITEKEVSERTGALRYPLRSFDSAFTKTLQNAFVIIDPRVTPHDDDILLETQSWEEHDSPYEELFLKQIAPRLLGDFAFQVLEPQRRVEAILQFDGDKKEKLDRWLGKYKRGFYDQRVDFAVQFPKTARFARGLVIEIDGEQHREEGQRHLDRRRNAACKKAGWDTLRIETREINNIPEEKNDGYAATLSIRTLRLWPRTIATRCGSAKEDSSPCRLR